jgi:hypothetical protein
MAMGGMHKHVPVRDAPQKFVTRREAATRWRCSTETVKRKDRAGLLHPVRLSRRLLLYELKEIEALEKDGATISESLHSADHPKSQASLVPDVGRRLS